MRFPYVTLVAYVADAIPYLVAGFALVFAWQQHSRATELSQKVIDADRYIFSGACNTDKVPDLQIQGPDPCPKCNCQPTPPWEFSWEDAGGFRHEICFDLDHVGRDGPCDDIEDLEGRIYVQSSSINRVWSRSHEWIPSIPPGLKSVAGCDCRRNGDNWECDPDPRCYLKGIRAH